MGRDILVDGYNVIKRDPSFQAMRTKSLASARELLITQLALRYRHTPHQVIVVFDGNSAHEQVSHERRVRVIYSRAGETADSVIARLASAARIEGREVELYSDDRAVQEFITLAGGSAQSIDRLTSHLNAPPRDIARRAHHRIAMRRKYGLDPSAKDEDDEPPSRGKKRKRR